MTLGDLFGRHRENDTINHGLSETGNCPTSTTNQSPALTNGANNHTSSATTPADSTEI